MYKSLELFQESLAQESKSQNTINTYTRNITLFLNWLESVTKEPFNNKITQMDTQAYCKYLSDEKKMSLNTINSKLTSIKKFSDFLSDNGYMPYIKVVQKKGKTDPQVEVLEKNELYKYLRDTVSSGNKLHIAIVQLILNTGIRESELCSLEMDEITMTFSKFAHTFSSKSFSSESSSRIEPLFFPPEASAILRGKSPFSQPARAITTIAASLYST